MTDKSSMKIQRFPFLIEVLLFSFILGSDRALKTWAIKLDGPFILGPLHLETVYNFGVIGGNLSSIPVLMKTMTLASIGAFIFCFYLFSRIMFPMRSSWLKNGLTVFNAGICGNVLDRFLVDNSAVIDFIHAGHFVLNPADIYQFSGFLMVCFGFWKDSQTFWSQNDQRKIHWIMPGFQWKISLLISFIGVMSGLVTTAMSYVFLKIVLQDQQHLNTFLFAIGVLQATLSLILFMCGTMISGKIAGPLFAIHRYLIGITTRHQSKFKLRAQDEFREFEGPLNAINEKLHQAEKKDAA